MKTLLYCLAIFLIMASVYSCNKDVPINVDEKYSFQITGVKQSMNAEFIDYNSRNMESPVGSIYVTIYSIE